MYQIPELKKIPGLFHVFSEKSDGNMANAILGKPTDFKKVLKNRIKFFKKINAPIEDVVCMWVQGKDGVKIASIKNMGISMLDTNNAVKTDSLITNKKSLYLFLLIADCTPVILFDPKKKVIAVVHAGWKGVDLEIVKKTVTKLETKYLVDPGNIIAGIGPAVRKDDFIKSSPLQKDDPKWQPFLEKVGDDTYKVDVVGLCKKQLIDSGVLNKNIIDCGINTTRDNRFFSHVREGNKPISQQGRFACVIALK